MIADWIGSQPPGTRQRLKSALNTLLMVLETRDELDRPAVGQLHGKCRGLYELVLFVDKIQFRPIGCYGPRPGEFTLLAGATEKGSQLFPENICATAQARRLQVRFQGRTDDHYFD